jgi:hypothetical protein
MFLGQGGGPKNIRVLMFLVLAVRPKNIKNDLYSYVCSFLLLHEVLSSFLFFLDLPRPTPPVSAPTLPHPSLPHPTPPCRTPPISAPAPPRTSPPWHCPDQPGELCLFHLIQSCLITPRNKVLPVIQFQFLAFCLIVQDSSNGPIYLGLTN